MTGCKEKDTLDVLENVAIVTYSDPSVDGCGWKINIDQKEFHPVNLDEKYEVDQLVVNIKYNLLSTTWECLQWTPKKFQKIKIIDIVEVE